jgi:hypothetical protein
MIAVLANLLTVALAQGVDRHRHVVGMYFRHGCGAVISMEAGLPPRPSTSQFS